MSANVCSCCGVDRALHAALLAGHHRTAELVAAAEDAIELDAGIVAEVLAALDDSPTSGNALAARLRRRKQDVHAALRHLDRLGAVRHGADGWEPASVQALQHFPQLPIPTSNGAAPTGLPATSPYSQENA